MDSTRTSSTPDSISEHSLAPQQIKTTAKAATKIFLITSIILIYNIRPLDSKYIENVANLIYFVKPNFSIRASG